MKYEITWINNGKMFTKIVSKSRLADVIAEATMWGHTLTVRGLKEI